MISGPSQNDEKPPFSPSPRVPWTPLFSPVRRGYPPYFVGSRGYRPRYPPIFTGPGGVPPLFSPDRGGTPPIFPGPGGYPPPYFHRPGGPWYWSETTMVTLTTRLVACIRCVMSSLSLRAYVVSCHRCVIIVVLKSFFECMHATFCTYARKLYVCTQVLKKIYLSRSSPSLAPPTSDSKMFFNVRPDPMTRIGTYGIFLCTTSSLPITLY